MKVKEPVPLIGNRAITIIDEQDSEYLNSPFKCSDWHRESLNDFSNR